MIENKDTPQDYVSIRQVWLMQINRCTEALTNRYRVDVTVDGSYRNIDNVGQITVIESVLSLYYSLVDFGQATLKTEAKQKLKEMEKQSDYRENRIYYFKQLFEFILETLNKYGMLFESQPQGYSNVEMEST